MKVFILNEKFEERYICDADYLETDENENRTILARRRKDHRDEIVACIPASLIIQTKEEKKKEEG